MAGLAPHALPYRIVRAPAGRARRFASDALAKRIRAEDDAAYERLSAKTTTHDTSAAEKPECVERAVALPPKRQGSAVTNIGW